MNIKTIKRPWQRQTKYGNRLSKDPFYQSTTWKRTKALHKQGYTIADDGFKLSNIYCIDCYNESGLFNSKNIAIDHIKAIKEGGDKTSQSNLRSLCESHHNRKSAIEGNQRRKP